MKFFPKAATIFAVAFIPFSAQAAELPPLLETALARAETANAVRWGFTQEVSNGTLEATMRFEPARHGGAWELLTPDEASFDEEQAANFDELTDLAGDPDPDADLTYEQLRTAIGDQPLELIEENDTHVVYGFAPQPWDDIEEDEAPILQHLRAEITLDRETEIISHIRMYAPENFHHMVVALITEFEQEMTFEAEPITGLPLMTSFSQDVKARAMFSRINRSRTEIYSDFLPMSRQGAALSCGPATCPGEFTAAQ